MNTGANLCDIAQNKNSGFDRNYLIEDTPKSHFDYIVFIASIIIKDKPSFLGISSKFKYGKRDKRIEILSLQEESLNIYKITKYKKVDKEAFELDNLIDTIALKTKKNILGNLVIIDKSSFELESIFRKKLNNKILFKSFYDIYHKCLI